MPSFDYTVDLERSLLRQVTSSQMMARMYLHRMTEEMFTSNERRFIFESAKRAMETRANLTRSLFEYDVKSMVSDSDASYFISEWNLIEVLEVEDSPEVLIERIEEANVGRKTLSLAEEVLGHLERGSISEAVEHLKRESMMLGGKKDDRPLVELTDYQRRIDLINEKRSNPEKYLGMKIGFKTFDDHTGGVYKGEMTLIAGITGQGKSTLCKQIAYNIVKLNPGKNVLHIANEEYLEQVEHKYDANISTVPYNDFKKATISDEDAQRWVDSMETIKAAGMGRIFVKEVPAFTNITLIERAYRELENKGIKIDVIVIDHLPHVIPIQKAWGENDERAKAASECKELARWLHTAVIVPTQAATEVEAKVTKGRRAGKLDVYGSKGQVHVANTFMIITSKGADDSDLSIKEYLRDVYLMCDVKKNRDGPPFYFFVKHRVSMGVVDEIDESQIGGKAGKGADDAAKEGEEALRQMGGKSVVKPVVNVRKEADKFMEAVEGLSEDGDEDEGGGRKGAPEAVSGILEGVIREAGGDSEASGSSRIPSFARK